MCYSLENPVRKQFQEHYPNLGLGLEFRVRVRVRVKLRVRLEFVFLEGLFRLQGGYPNYHLTLHFYKAANDWQ